MSEGAKKVGGGLLLLAAMGGGVTVDQVLEWAFGAGELQNRVEHVEKRLTVHEETLSAHQAMIMKTRENLDDKISELLRLVSRIEGKLERK